MIEQIRFDDGAAYARYMGQWSQLAGDAFLEWLALPTSLRWLDVGCGSGAFTEQLCARCAPSSVVGIDPSQAQLEHARARPALRSAELHRGTAMALPFDDSTFDVAVMPLVICFVPEPATGVAEMARVVRPGGTVAAYIWELEGAGFPYESLHEAIRGRGLVVPDPPRPESTSLEALVALWSAAGLQQVETMVISVQRTFDDFDDYWTTVLGGASVAVLLANMASEERALIREQMQRTLHADASGRITVSARANAVRGQVPRAPLEASTR